MPKPYRRPHSNAWWLRRLPYTIFMLREWAAVFMALYLIFLVALVAKVNDGEAAYQDYVEFAQRPIVIAIHVVLLAFTLLHTLTWFQAIPKATRPPRIGGERPSGRVMIASVYGLWVIVSAVVAAIVLVG
jgi:fumarate reductase subunit C